MSEDEDQALVEACRGGNRAAFAALVTRYQRTLYNAAYRVLGNAEDARDIVQVVFIRVLERLDEYDPEYRFFSWIYRIAINESISLLRRHGHDEPLDDRFDPVAPDDANPETALQHSQVADRIQGALLRMKANDRVVLTLRHFSDCSYREMADILAVDEKTVKSRLFEARGRLAALLQDFQGN